MRSLRGGRNGADLVDEDEVLESAEVDEPEYYEHSISFEINLQTKNVMSFHYKMCSCLKTSISPGQQIFSRALLG